MTSGTPEACTVYRFRVDTPDQVPINRQFGLQFSISLNINGLKSHLCSTFILTGEPFGFPEDIRLIYVILKS